VPELPDLDALAHCWEASAGGHRVGRFEVRSAFLLRTVAPRPADLQGHALDAVRREGKRIVLRFREGSAMALHLMIAGRIRRRPPGQRHAGRDVLCVLGVGPYDYVLTEASRQRRASLHLFSTPEGPASLRRDGIEPLEATADAWRDMLKGAPHLIKRVLTDPDCVSGVGNAYSDEILHRARLSPMRRASSLSESEVDALQGAAIHVLSSFRSRILDEFGPGGFPETMTAFRPDFAVHGRFRQPCPDCGAPVQRIVRGAHEANYCAACQTGGRVLADRALSRLMHGDWPATLEEWEERLRPGSPS
jgi:formamidopyrimidine-DNA glycosylase